MSYLAANFFEFAHDAETLDQLLGEDLDRLRIQTKASHGRLVQGEDM